jgi:TRAP-type C4-dicarboxylate transport system permease small subunit
LSDNRKTGSEHKYDKDQSVPQGNFNIFTLAERLGNGLEKLLEFPVLILSILMTATVLLGVFFRYVLRMPLGWSEEFSRYAMIWMALLSVALCIWRHEHVGVTMFIKKLPRLLAKVIIFLSNSLVLYFLWILVSRGFVMAEGGKAQLATALGTDMYWWLMAVPVSALVCMVMLICKMVLDIRRKNLDEILMSEEVVDAVKREEGLDF